MFINKNKKIAVQGLFRSGTNYTKTLLENNFKCDVSFSTFGWKHSFIPEMSNTKKKNGHYDLGFLLTKNPFSFINSLYNYHIKEQMNIKASQDFNEFLTERVVIYNSHNPNSQMFKFKNPAEMWNQLNFNFYHTPKFKHIKYEELLEDPYNILNDAIKTFDVPLKTSKDSFVIPEKKVKRMGDKKHGVSINDYEMKQAFDSSEYSKNLYMTNFTKQQKDFVLKELDEEVIQLLRYSEDIDTLINA